MDCNSEDNYRYQILVMFCKNIHDANGHSFIHSFIFVYWEQKWQNASAQVIAIQDEYKNSKNS